MQLSNKLSRQTHRYYSHNSLHVLMYQQNATTKTQISKYAIFRPKIILMWWETELFIGQIVLLCDFTVPFI